MNTSNPLDGSTLKGLILTHSKTLFSRWMRLGLLLVTVLTVTACKPTGAGGNIPEFPPGETTSSPTLDPTQGEMKGVQSGSGTETPTDLDSTMPELTTLMPTEASVPTDEPTATESGTGRVFTPSNRTALEASDPGSFDLDSGDLQLVEFFAFW
jgi:hypothetical protein